VRTAVVLDEHALRIFPGLEGALASAGALVMRSFKATPNPELLRRYTGVAVVGGRDKPGLIARLERATATLAVVPAPVIGALPPGVPPTRDLLGPGVVDLLPAGTPRAPERILLMARVPVVTGSRPKASVSPAGRAGHGVPGALVDELVAVASSTGGVWVVGAMLRDLSPSGRAVVLAQHMDAEFVSFFARWLAGTSGWNTVVVEGEVPLRAGSIYLPSGGMDLVVDGDRARAVAPSSRYVPSADRLLSSVASRGRPGVGVVLSGMGSDGAAGLAELVRAGGMGICQEPTTAVVASMPESALRASPAAHAVPPEALAQAVAMGIHGPHAGR